MGIHLLQSEDPDNMPKISQQINPKDNHISFQVRLSLSLCLILGGKKNKEQKMPGKMQSCFSPFYCRFLWIVENML